MPPDVPKSLVHAVHEILIFLYFKQAILNWKPSDLPDWLTRDVYLKRVQPALASVAKSRIRSALGVSEPYASDLQAGKRIPHPRHWQALAGLVGIAKGSVED